MFTKHELMKIKSRAQRLDLWFKVLSKTERTIINLTIKCVEKVRSQTLAKIISEIIGKILKTLESQFLTKVEEVGKEIAEKLSRIAQKWGNKNASNWKQDRGFIRYLGVSALIK